MLATMLTTLTPDRRQALAAGLRALAELVEHPPAPLAGEGFDPVTGRDLSDLRPPATLTVDDVAQALNRSPRYVRGLCRAGRLRATRDGNGARFAYRITPRALDAYLRRNAS